MRVPPAFRYRDFRLFVSGYIPSQTGDYIQLVVQNWLVWELTQSAFYLGLIGFFEFAPRFIFGPLGGVITDRVDRLKLMILTQILALLQTAIFAFLIYSGLIQFWHIAALVTFMAIVHSVSTTAQQVFICSVVPQESVISALALNSATHNLTKIIGPSIGGILLTLIGAANCILIHFLTILAMLGALLLIREYSFTAPSVSREWYRDIAEGFSYVRHNPRVLTTILLTYTNGFFGISYSQFLPVFAQEILKTGPTGYGFLLSAPGVGAVAISFFLSTHTRLSRMQRLLLGSSAIYAAGIFLFALSRLMMLSLLLLAAVGAMQMSYRVLARAIIQEEAPPALLGRAMSLFFLDRGFGSLGALFVGSLATIFPVYLAVALSAAGCGLSTYLIPRSLRRKKAPAQAIS